MKFTLVKNISKDVLLRPLLGGLLSFMFLFISADILLKADHIGLTPADLSQTLYGNEENYIDPISEHFLLELLHSDVFFIMMTLLTLSTIFARLVKHDKLRSISIHLLMVSSLASLFFLALAYYTSSVFVIPYILTYYTWHILSIVMICVCLAYLFIPKLSSK